MGGSVSKSTIISNKQTLDKLDLTLSDILTSTLKKYSELLEQNVYVGHEAQIETFRKRGAMLSDIPAPQVSIQDTFKAKCTNDLVMIIKDKLKKFPKWALVERGFLFNSKKPIPFELQDPQNMNKEQLCQKMAELYTALLLSIEVTVRSLFACRISIDNVAKDSVYDSPVNEPWFKSMNDLQKLYEKHAREAKKLFNSLNSVSVLDSAQVDQFKTKLGNLNNKMQTLPQQCTMMFDQIKLIPTMGKEVVEECKKYNIKSKVCNQDTINIKKQELEAKRALENARLQTKTALSSSSPSSVKMPTVSAPAVKMPTVSAPAIKKK